MYAKSKSGWMETDQSIHWVKDLFIVNTRPRLEGPVVLYLDSHISIDVIDIAIENNIHLICLPPHPSHV